MLRDLDAQARSFAADTSDVLNRTICNGVRITPLTTANGKTIMGFGIKRTKIQPDPIPIGLAGTKPRLFLYLAHSYELDPEGVYLAMSTSTMSLYSSEAMEDDDLVVAIDYTRQPVNSFPGSHLHVSGERSDLDELYLGDRRKSRTLRDLHLPVGGKRFRPTLEDLIEFVVTEEMVVPRDGGEAAVAEHRSRWHSIQLKAAVRRNPNDAASALREAGWCVSGPDACKGAQ